MRDEEFDQAAGLRRLLPQDHGRIIAVLGARQGAGATALVNGLAAVFARGGKSVLVLDEHLSHANVAHTLGLLPRYDLLQAVQGDKPWRKVVLQRDDGVAVLPVARAMQSLPGLGAAQRAHLLQVLRAATAARDVVLVDAARTLQSSSHLLGAEQAPVLLLDASADGITAAYALLKQRVRQHAQQAFDIVVNRAADERSALAVFDNMVRVAGRHVAVQLDYLGHIPVDENVQRATQWRRAVTEAFPSAAASLAMREVAQGLLGVADTPGWSHDNLDGVRPFPSYPTQRVAA